MARALALLHRRRRRHQVLLSITCHLHISTDASVSTPIYVDLRQEARGLFMPSAGEGEEEHAPPWMEPESRPIHMAEPATL